MISLIRILSLSLLSSVRKKLNLKEVFVFVQSLLELHTNEILDMINHFMSPGL